jgi:tRNA 5-methylaminomethyl-2-thiouridine biosynthesis bifunctional protein
MAEPPPSDVIWTAEGAPRSSRFDDVYFAEDGLAESRAVFLTGCGLPEAWRGRRRFTVAELGFGTGLNILALLDLWRQSRPPGGALHLFSVEAFPLRPEEAARALACFPQLADLAAPLLHRWPTLRRGWLRVDWPDLGAVLDLAVGEAAEGLRGWTGSADAWFLDGFAPSRNPEMWRPEVLDLVAARSAPGARLATFTVAGEVRRGLEARGFAVSREPGHGRKRQRLEARRHGEAPPQAPAPSIAIVGAGIAGAGLARAFRALGAEPLVFDPTPAGGASGGPAALAAPRLDVGDTPAARLFAQAHGRAASLYRDEVPQAVLSRGALHLSGDPRDEDRFARLAALPIYPEGAFEPLPAGAATARLGDPTGPRAVDGRGRHARPRDGPCGLGARGPTAHPVRSGAPRGRLAPVFRRE